MTREETIINNLNELINDYYFWNDKVEEMKKNITNQENYNNILSIRNYIDSKVNAIRFILEKR